MTRPLLTATMIVRDDKTTIRRAVESVLDHVDELVVVDTGSTDGTLGVVRDVCKRKRQLDKLKTGSFKWCDDFAAARQAADDLATGEFLIWLDADDEVRGADNLREYCEKATDDVVAFFCAYQYARDETGNPISELWRERVVRNNGTKWTGRLHEHKLFTQGAIVKVDPQVAEWVHHRDHTQRTGERNLRILDAWHVEEPDSPRVVQSLAMEYMGEERHQDAADMFARYLALPGEPPDRRAQATRHMCVMLMLQNRVAEARVAALQSLAETWLWADTHLTLAECDQTVGRPDQAIVHARTAMEIGKPDTLLIINPLQYTAHPRAVTAVCLAQMGRFEEAVRVCEEALAIAPAYPLAAQQLPSLRAQLRKHLAVGSVTALTDVLVEAGEPLKARELLDCAPWYVTDDPRIVQRRGEVSLLIRDRRENPAVLADDEAADEFVARHLEAA